MMRQSGKWLVMVGLIMAAVMVFSGNALAAAKKTNATKPKEVKQVNINTATVKELNTLKGIGKVLAKKIVDYRTKNGEFATVEDLMKVDKRITQKVLDDNKDRIILKGEPQVITPAAPPAAVPPPTKPAAPAAPATPPAHGAPAAPPAPPAPAPAPAPTK